MPTYPFLFNFTVPESMLDKLGHVHFRNFREITEKTHEVFLHQFNLDVENALKKGFVLFMESDPGEYKRELFVGDNVEVSLWARQEGRLRIVFDALLGVNNTIAAKFCYTMIAMDLKRKRPVKVSESPFSVLFA